MSKSKKVIKKYGDRRLYDTAERRYVNLEDVGRMIRDGVEVEVVEARSGKDITRVVLTQIIVEASRDQESGPPLQLLRQLVMASDRATHEFLTWYLNSTLDVYEKARESFQSRVSGAKTAVSSPLEFVRNLLSGHPSGPEPEPDNGEVESLRRRVQELEERLARTATSSPSRKRSGAKDRTTSVS